SRPVPVPPELAEALGIEPRAVGRNRFDFLVELATEAEVRSVRPDYSRLAAMDVRGTIITAPSGDPRFDFVSRFFAPAVGVPEDPVCGSAHCCLAPYWCARWNKSDLIGHQVSQRGGVVRVGLRGGRVRLAGQAVTVLKGRLEQSGGMDS
ncbi:MAG: PhzF family phenazine biosynthesis protein, partial [Planctomycetales bacterium]